MMGKRRGARLPILLLGLGLSLLTTCGLERLVYLAPVRREDVSGGLPGSFYFDFRHNTDNDAPEFLGYELFYKFYVKDPGDMADAEVQVAADIEHFRDRYIRSPGDITGKGFFKMRHENKDVSPLLRFSYNEAIRRKIRLDFLNLTLSPPGTMVLKVYNDYDGLEESNLSETIVPKRDVVASPENVFKDFLPSEFNPEDRDIDKNRLGAGFSDPGSTLIVSICVVAYGWSIDSGPLYSEVTFLNHNAEAAMEIVF